MKNLNLFRKSARGSEGSTLASAVVRPSFDCRSTVVKHLAFMLLFLLGSLNVWGEDVVYKTATFSSSSFSANTQSYTNNSFSSTTDGFQVNITNANNNNKGWEYIKMGYGKAAETGTITTDAVIDEAITKVELVVDAITSNKVNSIKLYTKASSGDWSEAGSFDKSVGTKSVTLSSPTANLYYKIEISCAAQKAAIQLSEVKFYKGGTGEPAVLKSIAVSGDLTNKNYENTDALNLAGLTVTGSYDDESEKEITSGITWKVRTNSTSEAVNLDAYTLTAGQTSVEVQATVNEVSSDWKTITGLTVTAASPKITITQNEVADFAASYAEYTWTAGGVSGKLYAYKNAGMQFNPSKTGYYVYNTDPIPGRITKITMTKASGTDRSWTPYVSTTAMTSASGTALDAQTVTTSGASWDVTGSNSYFYLTVSGGATVIGSIVIEYTEEAGPAVDAPSISGDVNFVGSTTVTISHEDADHIYYTTNGDAPTTSSAEYTAPFPLTNTATVKAIAVKGSDVSAVAEKTFEKVTVMSVAEALEAATGNDKYVKGIIASIEEVSTEHGNATYNLKDEGQTNSIKIYRGKYLNNVNFTAADQIIVGDEVTVFGTVSQYQSVNQFAQGNYIVAIKPAARLAWSAASYDAELGGSNSFPTLTNTNSVSVTYSSSNTDAATINASTGAISLVGVGTTTITASFAGNESYKANSASYTLNVAAAVIRADISFNVDGGTAVEGLTQQSNLPNPLPATSKAGKNFGGWYTDAEKTVAAVAGAAVTSTEAITLYAKWLDPYTVAQARAAIDASEGVTGVYATGIVSEIVTAYSSQNGNISYNISADGTTTADQLQAYKGKAAGGANFTSADDVQVGDIVVVYGNLKKYNSIYEFDSNNQLYSITRPEVAVTSVELAATATVKVGKTINLSASVLPADATNKVIEWSIISGNDNITLDNGTVTGVAVGTAVIRATAAADENIYAVCTVTIAAADPVYAYYNYEKVTATSGIEDGEYLIVYEDGNVAFNGGLETLDAVSNTIAVEIEEGKIVSNQTTDAAAFTINVTAGSLRAASGKYAGVTSYSNGLTSSDDAIANSFSIDEDGNAVIVVTTSGGDMTLRYNTADNQHRFRYYKSGQQAIQLYKKVGTNEAPKANAELAWDPAEDMVLTVGDAFIAPTLNNPNNIAANEIEITSSNTELATVSEGVVSLVENATGEATITATFAGNESYKPASVSYKITVNAAATPAASGNIVILAEFGGKYYAMTNTLDNGALAGVEVEKDGDKIVVSSEADKAAIQWTATVVGENTTLMDADNKYITGSNSASLSLEEEAYNWNWDGEKSCYISSAYTNRGLFFNSANNVFKGYALSNITSDGYAATEVIEIDPEDIVISSKVDPELAYTPASDEITVGGAWSAPVLGYVEGFDGLTTITYESSNEAIATVSDAGVIALAGGTGTATITATFGGNASYLAGSASYTITVNKAAATPTSTVYRKVTATEDITDGQYLIVYEGDATHDAVAFNGSLGDVDQAMKALAVAIVNGEITGNTDLDAATFTIDVTTGTLKSASGWYIGREANSNGLDKSESETYANTFAITDGAAVITSAGGPTLRYNYASDQLRFRYYKSGQQAIQLYKKVVEEPVLDWVEVRSELVINRHYTVCLDKAVSAVRGASFWKIENRDNAGTMVYLEEVDPTEFAAGTPFIIQATDTKLEVVYTGDATTTAGSNGALRGTLEDMSYAELQAKGEHIYLLIQNAIRPIASDNYLNAKRAYIDYDELNVGTPASIPGRRVKAMPMAPQVATGVDQVPSDQVPNTKVLIDGQLYIMYNGTMYNVQGQLVK